MSKFFKNFGFWIILIIAIFAAYTLMNSAMSKSEIEFSQLIKEIKDGNVKTLTYEENMVSIEVIDSQDKNNVKTCYIPSIDMLYSHVREDISKQVENGTLTIVTPEPETMPWWISMLPSIIIFIIGIIIYKYLISKSKKINKT